jgi:hypothetical protein
VTPGVKQYIVIEIGFSKKSIFTVELVGHGILRTEIGDDYGVKELTVLRLVFQETAKLC